MPDFWCKKFANITTATTVLKSVEKAVLEKRSKFIHVPYCAFAASLCLLQFDAPGVIHHGFFVSRFSYRVF